MRRPPSTTRGQLLLSSSVASRSALWWRRFPRQSGELLRLCPAYHACPRRRRLACRLHPPCQLPCVWALFGHLRRAAQDGLPMRRRRLTRRLLEPRRGTHDGLRAERYSGRNEVGQTMQASFIKYFNPNLAGRGGRSEKRPIFRAGIMTRISAHVRDNSGEAFMNHP